MPNNFEETFEAKKARVKDFRPIDDSFFEVMIKDRDTCEEILRVILEDGGLTVKHVHVQESFKNLYGRSVRLDAFCVMGDGTFCNIEVQKANNDNHLKRVRYNAACATTVVTNPGDDFEDVPTVRTVYITESDFMRQGRTIYHAEMTCRETKSALKDGLEEIFVNTAVDDGTDIAELMQCFLQKEVRNPKFPKFSNRVHEIKETEEGVNTMCEVLQKEGIETIIDMCKEYKKDMQEAIAQTVRRYHLTNERATALVKELW